MCTSRDFVLLSSVFKKFAEYEATELASPMYAELASTVSSSSELLEIASHCSNLQPVPNLLFASVQFLLISGTQHPLRSYFPMLAQHKLDNRPVSAVFRDFCLEHRGAIIDLMQKRRVQSNVVSRCACLLPAFSKISQETANAPLFLIDLGASAGLNLNFHRYSYTYTREGNTELTWGKHRSSVRINTELRGNHIPHLKASIELGDRVGIDLAPIELDNHDSVNWLRALVWPEHVEHRGRLDAAITEFKQFPASILAGDVVERLPEAIGRAPANQAITIYTTISAYQFPSSTRHALDLLIVEFSQYRPIHWVTLESNGSGQYELAMMRYQLGRKVESELLARASPHGLWLEWLSSEDDIDPSL